MIVLALVLIVLAGGVCDAAGQRLPLRTYSSADGLAGDHVEALLPDSRGFLWIGTNTGLSRFDGREFRTFGPSDGLPHPAVNALLEDRAGVIHSSSTGDRHRRRVARAIVESPVGIVVERSMYWNTGSEIWAAGTGVVATPLPPR